MEIQIKLNIRWESKEKQKREFVSTVDEQKFTSALLKITRDIEQRVYFLVGHGERSTDDFSINGYNQAKEELEKQDLVVITKLIKDVVGDIIRDIWLKRSAWK